MSTKEKCHHLTLAAEVHFDWYRSKGCLCSAELQVQQTFRCGRLEDQSQTNAQKCVISGQRTVLFSSGLEMNGMTQLCVRTGTSAELFIPNRVRVMHQKFAMREFHAPGVNSR